MRVDENSYGSQLSSSLGPGLITTGRGGGGGVLPYMGYTGMCHSTGYVFCFSDSGTGYKNRPFSLEQGIFYFRFDSGIVSNFP